MTNDKSIKCLWDRLISYILIIMMMGKATHAFQGLVKDFEFCEVSKLTRTVVKSCPTDRTAVMEAANKKNCSAIKSTCLGSLKYHCVINPWGNITLEVCAPATHIRAGFCAEYNEGGGKIQEYYKKTCSVCSETYSSMDAYKYPECYPKLKVAGQSRRKLKRGNGVLFGILEKTEREEISRDSSLPAQSAKNGFEANIFGKIDVLCLQILLQVLLFFN